MSRRRICKALAACLVLATLLSAFPAMAAGTEAADSVYRNGNIYTVDEAFSKATALAIKGDRLVYVGGEAGVEAYIGPDTKVVDLGGETVIPGLVEGHMHVAGLGSSLMNLDCFWMPKQAILDLVKAAAEQAKPGEWIQGRGWMNTVWEDTSYPTKEELDAVAPNNPVFLTRACGHMGWANSKAIELAGITPDTPNPQGGEYLKNANGELLGCMTDTAMNPIRELIPELTVEQMQEGLLKAQEQLFSYGLTSAMDAGNSIEVYNEVFVPLYESGELKLRVYGMISHTSAAGETAEYLKSHPIDNENYEPLYNNHLSLRCVKMFADGSLGARSAAMLEPYSDREGHIGDYRYTQEQVNEVVKVAYDAGYQIATHCIGDGANNQMINAYEAAIKANPRDDHRLRIEHFQVVTPEDIDRALELGILTAMQFTHATSDLSMAEDRLGPERIQTAYAWRTVLDKGGIIIGGSDAPVEMVNPFHGLYAGVTRMTRAGEPEGGWYANQKVTREEALRAFTIWAAYGQFEEDLKGSLEPGKLADFVVIDRDYMTCPEEEIKDIQALMTVSGGEVVYTKDTSEPTILWQGKPVTLLSGALIEQPGTIYASASDLAGNISAVLEQGEGTVTVTCGEQSAELPVKTVNGADYVPVRAFFEGIGYAVTWCPDSRTVSTSRMSTADTSEAAAQPPVDEYSFQLGNFDGTVGAFCDVIMTGAKELAFSDPFDPEDEPFLHPMWRKSARDTV